MSEDNQIKPVGLEFTVRYTNGATGLIVGFIREFPFITGQGATFEELAKQLGYDLGLYFTTFPEGKEKLVKYGKIVGKELNIYNEKPPPLEIERPELEIQQPELREGWLEKPVPLVV